MRPKIQHSAYSGRLVLLIAVLIISLTLPVSAKVYANSPKRAVLVGGPVGGGFENMTIFPLRNMAKWLAAKGVKIDTFFMENAKWSEIKEAAQGADIFIFSCHGGMSMGSSYIYLADDYFLHDYTIESELKLKKNALVMSVSTCYAAGSSASDNSDIGIDSAIFRVNSFARPFFKAGAAGYFASNSGKDYEVFLSLFFEGKTLKKCFETVAGTRSNILEFRPCTFNKDLQIGIKGEKGQGGSVRYVIIEGKKIREDAPAKMDYNTSYVGYADYTINDFFKD